MRAMKTTRTVCTACIIVFAACPEQADQTEVSVQHMLAVHWGRFTSLWGSRAVMTDRQESPPVNTGQSTCMAEDWFGKRMA